MVGMNATHFSRCKNNTVGLLLRKEISDVSLVTKIQINSFTQNQFNPPDLVEWLLPRPPLPFLGDPRCKIRFALAAFIVFLVHCGPLTIDRIVLASADSVPLGDNHLLRAPELPGWVFGRGG